MINFFSEGVQVKLANRKILKSFIESIFKQNQTGLIALRYIFCDDDYLLAINREFLKHDFYTDIITFQLSGKNEPVEGEIYISIDRVMENAFACQTTLKEELHRVIFHGALHLCGLKDKTKVQIQKMRAAESKCLSDYFNVFHVKQ